MSSTRREGSEYHFLSLWYDSAEARTDDLPVVRQTLYHWAITLVLEEQESKIAFRRQSNVVGVVGIFGGKTIIWPQHCFVKGGGINVLAYS